MSARPPRALLALLVVALFAVSVPAGLASPRAAATPLQVFHSGALGVAAHRSPAPLGVHPAVSCPLMYPILGYGPVGGDWPLDPAQQRQTPCPPIAMDEVHGSFFSNVSGSAESFRIPVTLPNGTVSNVSAVSGGFYIGMVMRGDRQSPWDQSYAAVVYQPNGADWSESLAVYSIVNASYFSSALTCPGAALNFSWNGTYWCEVNEIGGGSGAVLQNNLAPGTVLSITFDGVYGSTGAARLWVNSSQAATNSTWTFNASMDNGPGQVPIVGNHSFEPAFRSSCPISCVLNWSMPFGLGFGAFQCPGESFNLNCNSYNQYSWIATDPIQVGSPEYLVNGAYTGDYVYLAPESASGVCNGQAPVNTVAQCSNFQAYGGTGYYPIFTFNGSQLNFGTNYSYTLEDFGGSNLQYLANAQPSLQIPFWFDEFTNDSRAGFIPPATGLNVSVRLQALGSVADANLTYSIAGATPTTVPMLRVSGTNSSGVYTAYIPSSGGNGRIIYSINATSHAGSVRSSPVSSVSRGPLPTFSLNLITYPSGCGSISFNGTKYTSGANVSTLPGYYPLVATPCYPYIFGTLATTSGLTLSPQGSRIATLGVSASGTVNASWVYVRPYDKINITTNPSGCGAIAIDNNTYMDGSSVLLLDSLVHSLRMTASCAGTPSFAGWTFVGNFSILGENFTPMGNGTLTANFISSTSAHSLIFYTSPTDCGGVLFQGAGYTNAESVNVALGTYDLGSVSCANYGFRNFSSSSGISFTTNSITVNGAGWIRATNYHLTEVHFATSPSSCGTITMDGNVYHNGQMAVVANNSTHAVVASACNGFSLLGLNTTGGLNVVGNVLIANGSGTLTAVFERGGASDFVAFLTDPSTCGTIYMNGLTYHNSNFTSVPPGTVYPISATPCNNYGFVGWKLTSVSNQGIVILGGNVYINASGSITAVFRPLVSVILYTQPTGCGTILLDNVPYTNNVQITVTSQLPYLLSAVPCPHYVLSGWLNTSGALINGGLVMFLSSSVLTAEFTLAKYPVGVAISPATCGLLHVGGNVAGDGTVLSLAVGNYSLTPYPCPGDHLVGYQTSGNLTLNGASVYVNGTGNLSAEFQPVPPSVLLSVPSSTLAGQSIEIVATIGTLVPPYNYTYSWYYGDGTTLLNRVLNSTTHSYANPGTYQVTVNVTDPYGRHTSATESVEVVAASVGSNSIPWTSVAIAVGVAAAIIAAVVVGLLLMRRRGPPPESADAPPAMGEGAEPEPLPAPSTPSLPDSADT